MTSGANERQSKAAGQKHQTSNFFIGEGSVEISEIKPQYARNTPDSRSYSLHSMHSIDENMREQLKKSLEQKNYESQSSTFDMGASLSKSKLSINAAHRNSTVSPVKHVDRPDPRSFKRQRTLGIISNGESQEDAVHPNLAQASKRRKHQTRDQSEKSVEYTHLRPPPAEDGRSAYSRHSKGAALSQQNFKETKEQRIFDVYMKAPYRLMDRSKQKRQQNRNNLKHF